MSSAPTESIERVVTRSLSRRDLLKRAVALSAGAPVLSAILAACGNNAAPTSPTVAPASTIGAQLSPTSGAIATPPATTGSTPAAASAPAVLAGGKPTGEVIFVEGTDVTTLDPQLITDTPSGEAAFLLYDGLLAYDLNLNPVPQLATKWDLSADKLTWTFHLRDGVKFSDGSPLTADDVAFTYNRIRDEKTGSASRSQYQLVTDVKAVDPTTVQFVTGGPFPDLLINLAGGSILSRKATEKYSVQEYGRHPVGSGPFMIGDWVTGDHVTFLPNPNYSGPEPARVAKITYKGVPEAATRAAMLRTGEADIAVKISPTDITSLKGDPNVTVQQLTSMYQISFEMNCAMTDPPLTNQKVRQALNYAVDKDSIVKNILQGLGEPMVSPFGPGIQYRATFAPYSYDPQKAKQLLADAGFANGFKMTLWSPDGRYLQDRQVAEAVQGYLKAVGIQADLKIWEWAPYNTAVIKDPTHQMSLLGRATPGADYSATRLFSKASWGQYNTTNFTDPTIEDLLPKARTTFDDATRAPLYKQIQQVWWDQAPWLFLHNQRAIVGVRKHIDGFAMRPTETMVLRNVTKK